ncbi:MAG: AEC family transporter [Aquabacterium sp.]
MQTILAVTVPFFALVLAGWWAARRHVLPESAIPGLNVFVLYFALPCMLLRFGLATPIAQLLNPLVLAVHLVCALLLVFFIIAITLGGRIGIKDAAFGAMVGAFPNSGFMGVPMLIALLGAPAAGPLICCILVDIFITSSLCIALAEAGSGGGGMRAAAARALRGTLGNPLPWAIALGAAGSVLGFKPSGPVDTVIRMLADAATPVALFTIGAVLYRAGQHAHGRTPLAQVLPVTLIKRLLHPLLVVAAAAIAAAAGAPMTPLQFTVLVLNAALPSAANVSILAERYGADNGRIARIILATTVGAFGSFTLIAWGLGVQGLG